MKNLLKILGLSYVFFIYGSVLHAGHHHSKSKLMHKLKSLKKEIKSIDDWMYVQLGLNAIAAHLTLFEEYSNWSWRGTQTNLQEVASKKELKDNALKVFYE